MNVPETPEIALFRNRAYDSRTGRWLQEAPLGVSEGLNLYQFNGNNPSSLTDPFGLKLCFTGKDVGEQRLAQKAAEKATNTIILVDKNHCATGSIPQGGKGYERLQETLRELINDDKDHTLTVTIGNGRSSSAGFASTIDMMQMVDYAACPEDPNGQHTFDLGVMAAHELLGHQTESSTGAYTGSDPRARLLYQNRAIRVENQYHAAAGQDKRCDDRGTP